MKINERHIIVRDSYNNKHFEVIQEDGFIFIYDYNLRRFLKNEEKKPILGIINLIYEWLKI